VRQRLQAIRRIQELMGEINFTRTETVKLAVSCRSRRTRNTPKRGERPESARSAKAKGGVAPWTRRRPA
jgi:hypothetical protein